MLRVQLSTREGDGYVVAALQGELDILDAAAAAVALAAAAAGKAVIIIDLEFLTFIDCSGLNALLCVLKRVRQAGGNLLLAAPRQQALRVLTLTRLVAVFCVHTSVEAAVASTECARRSAAFVRSG
jgi:anti-sigma B factor antagonist